MSGIDGTFDFMKRPLSVDQQLHSIANRRIRPGDPLGQSSQFQLRFVESNTMVT